MAFPLAVAVLLLVLALIAVRQLGPVKLDIWQTMFLGAAVVLLTGRISPEKAFAAIDFDVMLFLFGMFVVGRALEASGYLSHLSYKIFRRTASVDSLVLCILYGAGLASAFLMNDTCAVIGTPVVLLLAKKHRVNPKLLLLALAYAITLGSVASPIGNPQNLLIAMRGNVESPFVTFFGYLLVPTAVNLLLAYLVLRLFFRKYFHGTPLEHSREPIRDRSLALLSKASLAIVVVLVYAKVALVFIYPQFEFSLTCIALASAVPVLFLSPRRLEVLRGVDWHTLVFFTSMFVLTESVWGTGFFQAALSSSGVDASSIPAILSVSVILSQFISNVPLVALYLPVLTGSGVSTAGLMALAAGSTVAGNLFIFGAASNVIIIQNAEKRSGETLNFWDFARAGIPLTLLNVLVYWIFLSFL